MATRCTVNFYNIGSGSYDSIYGHMDGYLSHTGYVLLNCYNTEESVKKLISMGDFSVLRYTLEESTFYHRDRSEDYYLTRSASYSTLAEIPLQNYNYVFNGVSWFYFKEGYISLKPLTMSDVKEYMHESRK